MKIQIFLFRLITIYAIQLNGVAYEHNFWLGTLLSIIFCIIWWRVKKILFISYCVTIIEKKEDGESNGMLNVYMAKELTVPLMNNEVSDWESYIQNVESKRLQEDGLEKKIYCTIMYTKLTGYRFVGFNPKVTIFIKNLKEKFYSFFYKKIGEKDEEAMRSPTTSQKE